MIHNKLIALNLFLSQFYIVSSGLPQPAHILIILSIILFFLLHRNLIVDGINNVLIIFIAYIILINFSWTILSSSITYITSILYWVFNLLLFIYLSNQKYINFQSIQKSILISFISILIIWLLGLGRYDFYPRYNGYFNDPNQMAFWILCTLSIYFLKPNNKQILVLTLGLFLIILTASRSAILSVIFIFLSYLINNKFTIKNILLKILFLTIFIIVSNFFIIGTDEIKFISDRFLEMKVGEQADIRGYTALIKYPEYLIFGGGQGEYFRFSSTNHEIHSTWAGILFYYGILGLILFLFLLKQIFTKISIPEKLIFLAPLMYGFSTYGIRTIIFWYFIAFYVLHIKSKLK